MRWTYDQQADAIYITLTDDHLRLATVDLTAEGLGIVHLDVDVVTGELAGIEILDRGGGNLFVQLASVLAVKPEILGGEDVAL